MHAVEEVTHYLVHTLSIMLPVTTYQTHIVPCVCDRHGVFRRSTNMTTFQDLLGAWGQFSRGDHLSMSLGIIIPGQIYNRGPIDLCVRIVKVEYFRWWWVGGS